ncbi:MAG: hypothetical protein JO069_06145 [Verrucomicrobia bacterium]|nr:hypothetical protein [Verrucomicrobiota bacterium]
MPNWTGPGFLPPHNNPPRPSEVNPDAPKDGGGSLGDYRAAAEKLSPALRDTLYRVFSRARLPEDDPLWGLLVADSELLQGFLNTLDERFSHLSKRIGELHAQSARQHEQLRRDEQVARERHLEAVDAKLEDLRRQQSKLAEEKARGWDAALVNHLTTAVLAIAFTGLAFFMLDGKRLDDALVRAEERYRQTVNDVQAQDATDLKTLSSGANFLANIDWYGGGVTTERTDDGSPRYVISFGRHAIANVGMHPPNQAVIDLASEAKPAPSAKPRPTAR